MAEQNEDNKSAQPNSIYGFKTNLRQRKSEVELRLDKVDRWNIPYAVIPKRLIYGILMVALILLITFFFVISDLKRALYLAIPIILLLLGLLILIGLYVFTFPSFGSLLGISLNFISKIMDNRRVKKGKRARSKETGLLPVSDDGLIRYSDGKIGRFLYLDGKTSKTAYPFEVLQQEITAARYHKNRNRNTTEKIITSSQKQNTEDQLESYRVLEETNDVNGVKDLINLQYRYVDEKIDGARTTFVQYLLLISPDAKTLDDSLDTLFASTSEGLYYNVKAMNKQETERLLRDIKGLK